MRRAANHLLNAWLIAFLIAGPAKAAPALLPRPDFYAGKGGTKLLVVVAPMDARAKSLAGLVEHAAEAAADGSDRFQAVRGIDAFDAAAASARATKETEARSLATEAQKALDDLDSAKASKLFADSVAAWMQADLSRSIDGLVEAQIGKAAGHATSGENPQAKADLDKALLLAPKAKLSDAHFPPELLKYADGLRAKLAKAKSKLTVRTEPPGARVWVDGLYRGTSPVTADGLGAGQHIVSAGLAGWSLTTDSLPPGDPLLKLKLAEGGAQFQAAVDRIVQEPEGAGRNAAAKELAQAARADQVLVLVVKKGQTADQLEIAAARIDAIDGFVYASRSGASVVPTELRGITEWVGTLLATDEPRGASSTGSSASKAKGKGGGMSGLRIAGIGLLGGAVAAGASWAIFGISALGRVNQYKATFQVETLKSNQAARDGRTFALAADISWAVGAAFLVAGILLVILGGSSSSSSSSGGSRGSGPGAKPAEDDAMREYRRHQEEQKRAEEERQKKAAEQPPPEEKKPEEQKPAEEKKPDEAKSPAPEEKKKPTPEEEKAEKKKKADEEKAEKKKKADEEKAEKKRLADEAKKKAEDEKAEKKRLAEEAKKKTEEDKKKADDENAEKKRAAEEEKKKSEEEKKKSAEEDEKKKKDEGQRKADEEARRMDEERKKKEDEARKRDEDRMKDDRPPEKKKNDLEEDLRDDN